ncbi:putative disease resistance protein RGA3 [Euphorbia lathyris]|uniref:putative disease resistance protein RGA3 n=1 Tax=Euphorbia lathyris TaxID=212925 RepID=UPI00331318F3
MAESVLYDVAARIISNLSSSVLKEIGLVWGLKDELDKLRRTVSTIETVLLHAEEQSMENPQIKLWLGMLSEVMYDADDLLDGFSTEALRQQVMGGSKTAKKVRLFFSSSNQFAFGLKMGHKVKALRERLDDIAAERKFHLEERSVERGFVARGRDQTHSSAPAVVIGRQDEKEAIVKLLLSSDCEENVSVVPIVGIGGLGKTTLAQLVYSDDKVNNHFALKMWVCVSDEFDVQLLVGKVLESATRQATQNTQMDLLKTLLHEKINGRRYLLVLDDVWNEDVSKWFSFRDLLAGGARGSKIIITTRLRKIAEMSRPISIHELRGLSGDEAWLLFKQMAFKQGQVPSPSHEAIGREIVGKCCGVPLAIRAIGGMLYSEDLESEWLLFKNEELSKLDVYREDILPILKLSYNHLPSYYKHCFAYCSLYPKDYEIPVEELIHLWKAQGYLKSTDSNECLQDVGLRCFMNLFRLSFFQDVQKDNFGNIKSCKMHDLMHDLAISVAGDNFSSSHSGIRSIIDKTQHMSFRVDQNSISQDFSSLLKAKKVRTILPFVELPVNIKEEELDAVFCNLRRLRVLNLSYLKINELSSSIYQLKHLRYLDLSRNEDIKKLPDSITTLQNLQVLKLIECTELMQLPDNITKLVNLTDLDNDKCYSLTHMPQDIGKLTRLETLSRFVIAKDDSIFSKHSGGLEELHELNNLRGSLEIRNLKYLKNTAFELYLNEKKHLEKLTLYWDFCCGDCSANDVAKDEMGLEALCPNQNLKELSVVDYRGVKPPSWLISMTNLVSIDFQCCRSIQWLPPFDQLPYLKELCVWVLTNLEHIDVAVNFENRGSSSFFPSLTRLTLHGCPNLKGFLRFKTDVGMNQTSLSMEELPCFPCLDQLQIGDCPSLTYMPLFPKLKRLILMKDGIKPLMEVLKMTTTSTSQSTSSPFSTLSQLEDLSIIQMEDVPLDELLQYLPSLQYLSFSKCSCKSLSGDENDDGMQWQSLKVLRAVYFMNMPNLVSLPKGLQYVTTLRTLQTNKCGSLASIPEWIGNLVMLQYLIIEDCPQLSERCKNNTGEDWPKICHIPNISIDHLSIQRNGCLTANQ